MNSSEPARLIRCYSVKGGLQAVLVMIALTRERVLSLRERRDY